MTATRARSARRPPRPARPTVKAFANRDSFDSSRRRPNPAEDEQLNPAIKAFVLSVVDQRVAAGLGPIRDSLKEFTAEIQATQNRRKKAAPAVERARLITRRRGRHPPDTS